MAGGLVSRQFVKNIYAAKMGDVLQPVRIGEDYVVATVIEINKKGTQNVEKARNGIEPILRNKKKAETIKKKAGKITTLDAASAALGHPVETADSLRLVGQSRALGFEPKILGASFNAENKGKVIPEAIEGISGVYIIRVDSVATTPVDNANITEQRKTMYQNGKQSSMYRFAQVLKDAANITDSRAKQF
ncbi:MAG: hypothetical protein ACHQVK_03210 [Candidatus Paceibacterales bacterium]